MALTAAALAAPELTGFGFDTDDNDGADEPGIKGSGTEGSGRRARQHDRIPPAVPLAVANISRSQANILRAEWLLGIASDYLTVLDLLTQATSAAGRPLRRISLFQLLTAQAGCGPATVTATLERLRANLRCTTENPAMTVGWLLDNRTGGRRLRALTAALLASEQQPWLNWPFTAAPTAPTAQD